MQSSGAEETLASVTRVRRQARVASWAVGWRVQALAGLVLSTAGLVLLQSTNKTLGMWVASMSMPWFLLLVPMVLLLLGYGAHHDALDRDRIGLARTTSSPLATAAPAMMVGLTLLIISAPMRRGYLSGLLQLSAWVGLIGALILVGALAWVAIRERSLLIALGPAVVAMVATATWILAPGSLAGAVVITLGLANALVAVWSKGRLPVGG